MQATDWSLIGFGMSRKVQLPAGVQMLGWISRTNLHLLLHSHRSHQLRGKMWAIQVMMIHMVIYDEDMPPPASQQPGPDLDDDPVELHTGGDPPSQPPGGGAQAPVPEGE